MSRNLFSYFFLYAFLGWCTEVIYAAVKTGRFVNRGFLNGPLCPIYGVGIILVIYIMEPVKNNIFYMYFGAVLITSAIELAAGFMLEKIFHKKWWDYSELPFNIGGYISLKFSLTWGLACLLIIDRVHPLVLDLVHLIPPAISRVLLLIFTGLFLADLVSTVRSVFRLNKKLEVLDEITVKIRTASENIGENLASGTIALLQKKDEWEEKQSLNELRQAAREHLESTFFGQKRLLKAFPNLKCRRHPEALEKLKKIILHGNDAAGEDESRHTLHGAG